MNDNEESSIERFTRAFIEHMPKVVVTGVVAIVVFVIGLWINLGSVTSSVTALELGERPADLCRRVHDCPWRQETHALLTKAEQTIIRSEERMSNLGKNCEDNSMRVTALEQRVYEIVTKPSLVRPDPFTGTEGRELEERIKRLERK